MYTFTKDNLYQKPRRLRGQANKRFEDKKVKLVVLAVAICLILTLGGQWVFAKNTAYSMTINGEEVAIVKTQAQGQQVVDNYVNSKSKEIGKPVFTTDKIEYLEIKGEEITPADKLSEILTQKLHLIIAGAALVVNGEEKIYVKDKETAETILQVVKDRYTRNGDKVKTISLEFKDNVEVKEKDVSVNDIINVEQAVSLIIVGPKKMVTHTVKSGESLWTIARDNNMRVSDLREANPSLTSDKLDVGDEIKLEKAEPMIQVSAIYEKTLTEKVPFKTEVVSDKNVLRGKETVKQAGRNGSREVTYRVVEINGEQVKQELVKEKVIAAPVTKVVVRGTKILLASRGSGGSGSLAWPLRGQITSRYGYRGREFHTGMDINGSTGDIVRAAESGKIIFVGWNGRLGKTVKIDHGNGLQTAYAHLSAYSVSVGDNVDRGEVIGKVGSTGRSTGSHLHFEVRINGNDVNPIKYLE